jgi:hypothetical protein
MVPLYPTAYPVLSFSGKLTDRTLLPVGGDCPFQVTPLSVVPNIVPEFPMAYPVIASRGKWTA